jgi:hypothetical protein
MELIDMNEDMRRQIEDDAKKAGWDAYMLASGNGFKITNDEVPIVYRLLSDVISRSTDKTVQHEIGDADAVSIIMHLYMRMSEAMAANPRKEKV